jgi:hypothetical protein
MQTEFNALLQNQTWTLVPPQQATNLVGCKWVFKVKRKADGTKHVEIDFHFVHNQVAAKTLQILFIPSKEQIIDVLTKPIVSNRFQ